MPVLREALSPAAIRLLMDERAQTSRMVFAATLFVAHFSGAMVDTPDPLPLAGEFPAASREQWRILVEDVLRGASFEQRMITRSYDGLAIEALPERRGRARPVVGRAPGMRWEILQRIENPDPASANADALHELENGASGLSLVSAGAVGSYGGYGLPASASALARALSGVRLDGGIAIEIDGGTDSEEIADLVRRLIARRACSPAATNIRFGIDPIGAAAFAGGSNRRWEEIASSVGGLVSELAEDCFRGPLVVADGRIVHNAGGSEGQELAYVLAIALAYLRVLEASGTEPATGSALLQFRLSADCDQFLTIAKLRAARKLWARLEEACGVAPEPLFITAESAWRMMGKRDPHVNLVRTTVAVAAAVLGGADAITVLPFTAALGLPDHFARRLARTTQLILMEEAGLGRVADPAAGSGAIESLTEQLCTRAWTLFQEIEKAGGAWAALEAGLIQREVSAVAERRFRALAEGRETLTGISDFPELAETPVPVLDVPPPARASAPVAIELMALAGRRLAEPFERLRDASDKALVRTGRRPKVFVANLGGPSAFAARAAFARNLFESGGIEAVMTEGLGVPELAAAFRESRTTVVCLCGSDELYRPAAAALTRAGAKHIYAVTQDSAQPTSLKEAGVNAVLHPGSDAISVLTVAHTILGLGSSG